jgi:uncharacterized protein YecE (DUF72 family)
MIYVGTAAWTIPKIAAESFPLEGSHLERYAQVLNAVEINSSFYKDHQAKSYKRWADSTPIDFKFSVKLNKRFTHECHLKVDQEDLRTNLSAISQLGEKWGTLLLQFAGKQQFLAPEMEVFYKTIRERFEGPVALEARNLSWLSSEAIMLMQEYGISKVDADPEKCPGDLNFEFPEKIKYYRLHGSPEIYKSDYDPKYLDQLFKRMSSKHHGDVWCIFDNTTFGHATNNAVTIMQKGVPYERHQRIYDYRTHPLHTLDEY